MIGFPEDSYEFGCVLIHDIKCSNNCVFCRAGEKDLPEDLTQKGEARLWQDTVGLLKKGMLRLNVSGNEPLRYSKIVAYLKWIRPQFEKITLLDPGNRLNNEKFAAALMKTNIDVVVIPLYGGRGKVHAACVNNKSAFNQVTRGISNLLEHKSRSQQVEISTMILKQNTGDMAGLAEYVRDRFGLKRLMVNSPMATQEGVGRFFEDFNAPYADVRRAVLELCDVQDMRYYFRYIPPCLFTTAELKRFVKRGGVEFFNVHFTYNLADSPDHRDRLQYVERYRQQVSTPACGRCSLHKQAVCTGILRMHAEANRDFTYHPITDRSFEKIRSIVRYQKVNP